MYLEVPIYYEQYQPKFICEHDTFFMAKPN